MSASSPFSPSPLHQIVRASAGTGKTFALTTRYLRLLAAGSAPGAILATTFTRKAAGEILQRVLSRLTLAALDAKKRAELAEALGVQQLDPAQCRAWLVLLGDNLHRLAISTLDSFFARAALQFRGELDLPLGVAVMENNHPEAVTLRRAAIEHMLMGEDPDVMLELLRRVHHGEATRSVTDKIDAIISELEELYLDTFEEHLWRQYEYDEPLDNESFAGVLAQLQALLPTLSKREQTAVAEHLANARLGKWEDTLKKGIFKNWQLDPPTFFKKPVPPKLLAALAPLRAHAVSKLLGEQAHITAGMYEMVRLFHGYHEAARRNAGILLFSDIPRRLEGLIAGSDELLRGDLYFRLDQQVQHLLLDEFQDTSPLQWRILEPIAQEVVAYGDGERSFFCVGDVKQAIYGWRGGCAEIFDHLEHTLGDVVDVSDLKRSYRSGPAVLAAVNAVFPTLASNPGLDEASQLTAGNWAQRFTPHETAKPNRPSYACLRTTPGTAPAPAPGSPPPAPDSQPNAEPAAAPDDASTDADGPPPPPGHVHAVVQLVAELRNQTPDATTIGILVRTNSSVRELINALQPLHLGVSGEGGVPLTDEPVVLALLSALWLADHPGDSAARFHVLNSPLGKLLKLTEHTLAQGAAVAARIRQQLQSQGYATLLARWAQELAPHCDERSVVRVAQLVALAERQAQRPHLRPGEFVQLVRQQPVEEPSPARIRVMTIHRAKGLEFDIVVLPDLDCELGRVGSHLVNVLRDSAVAPVEGIFYAGNKLVQQFDPRLEAAAAATKRARLLDDLSGLYVALTRPRHALYMLVEPVKRSSKTGQLLGNGLYDNTAAAVLRHALTDDPEAGDPLGNELLYETGDPQWFTQLEQPEPASDPAPPQLLRIPWYETDRQPEATPVRFKLRRNLRRVAPSALEGVGTVSVRDLLQLTPTVGRQRGSALHCWFEQIQWLDDDSAHDPDDALLRAAAQSAGLPVEPEWLTQFRTMLTQPWLRQALRRPDDLAAVDLWRERRFAVREGDRLMQGMFDRVVIQLRDGQPLAAELLDFKTDQPRHANVDQLTEHYRPQMQAYRLALARLLKLKPAAVGATLLFVTLGAARSV